MQAPFLWLILLLRCAQFSATNNDNNNNNNLLFGVEGHPDCPCLTNVDWFHDTRGEQHRDAFNVSTYGWGCGAHDRSVNPSCHGYSCVREFPRPASRCETSWCDRNWCFVDPQHCHLLYRRSVDSLRYYSYAACGEMDIYTKEKRVAQLEGQRLKVGLNSNSGGWIGAYSKRKEQWVAPIEEWTGRIVELAKEAAYAGGFTLEITEPRHDLRNRSNAYFGSTSDFDFCIYLAALGYLDFCIAEYAITDIRAHTCHFVIMDSSSVYLIGNVVTEGKPTFTESAWRAFAPLSVNTWLFILFFVIPVFAALNVLHEYGQRGSSLPPSEKVVVTKPDKPQELVLRPVPVGVAMLWSVYQLLLSTFMWAWTMPVVTTGAKLNLLGVSFFTLTTLAAYTANLAAIFGQTQNDVSLHGLDEAIDRGYRFCMERNRMNTAINAFDRLNETLFALDGKDGKPGFLQNREGVFQMIDPNQAGRNASHCHLALAAIEDLERLHSQGQYCDLVPIGQPVINLLSGFPVAQSVAPALKTLFYQLRISGVADEQKANARPISVCPVMDSGGEGTALTITALSGIWIVTFFFCFLGVLIAYLVPGCLRIWVRDFDAKHQSEKQRVRPVVKRDHNGYPVEVYRWVDDQELAARSLEQMSLDKHMENNVTNTLFMASSHNQQPERVVLRFSAGDDNQSFYDGSGQNHHNTTNDNDHHQPLAPVTEDDSSARTLPTTNHLTQEEGEQLQVPRSPPESNDAELFSEDFSQFAEKLRQRLQPRR